MPDHLPDDSELIELAGEAAFERGLGYWRARRVTLSKVTPSALAGDTHGTANHFDESFETCRRTEELARCASDFDLLQRVLRRDPSHEWQHFQVLESLREFGRAREALAWAELAVKQFPKDGGLCASLAECLAESGMDEDALEQMWQRFRQHPEDDG